MRTAAAIAILCVFMAGCSKDPAPASTAPASPKPDAGLKDLLKRADAVTPKDAPDMQPAVPPGGAPPEKVVVIQGNRPAPAPYYGSSATSYSRTPGPASTAQKSETETMMDRAEQTFGYRISNLSSQKSNISSLRAQKTTSCTGTMPAEPVNGDFPASAAKLSQSRADSPQCKMMTAQLEREERSFRQMVDSIEVEAGRMGIFPGVIRDLYTRHGFSPY